AQLRPRVRGGGAVTTVERRAGTYRPVQRGRERTYRSDGRTTPIVDRSVVDAGLEEPSPVVELPPVLGPTEIPVEVLDWWARLIHEPKLDYAVKCVDYELGRAEKPARPNAKWARKVERQAERYCLPYRLAMESRGEFD